MKYVYIYIGMWTVREDIMNFVVPSKQFKVLLSLFYYIHLESEISELFIIQQDYLTVK